MSYIETTLYDFKNPSLIFIHGSLSSSIIWIANCNKILKINPKLNIFIIDLMGAGLSSAIPNEYSYMEFVEINKTILHEFIKRKNLIDPIIISSSYGGLINLEYNIEYPTRSIIFNPPGIFHLINKYQHTISLLTHYDILRRGLGIFSPEIIYKLGLKFGLDLETIYWAVLLRRNTLTNNILKAAPIKFLSGYCTRSIIRALINRNDIKSKCNIIFSLDDDLVGDYNGLLLETYGFDIQYLDHSHTISTYKDIAEYILNCIKNPVKWTDKGVISYTNDKKYYFYPSPYLSRTEIDLMVNDIKYFS